MPPGTEVELALGDLVRLRREPLLQMLGVGVGRPDQLDRRVERALQAPDRIRWSFLRCSIVLQG